MTRPGIDPGTVRLVAQRLNHYATPGGGGLGALRYEARHKFYRSSDIVSVLKYAMGLACGTHSREEKFLHYRGGRIQGNIQFGRLISIWVPQQKSSHWENSGYYIYHLF
jgi:hypothetical protein